MRLRNIPGAGAAIAASPFVIENPETLRGHWRERFGAAPDAPVRLEIGMGKGRFLMETAKAHPEICFLGLERYESVLVKATAKLAEEPLPNLLLLREEAERLPEFFAPGEVDLIYLNFSDPWPKKRHAKRRLTSERFLPLYGQVLSPGGRVEFKTDNRDLFDWSLESIPACGWEILACSFDLHADPELSRGNIMTEYEEKFSGQGKPICKLICAPGASAES